MKKTALEGPAETKLLSRKQLKQIHGGLYGGDGGGGDEGGGEDGGGGTQCLFDAHCGFKGIPCYPWAARGHCIGGANIPENPVWGVCRWAGCPS